MSAKDSSPPQFREIECSPARQRVESHLQSLPKSVGFGGVTSCDMQKYEEFVTRCRQARCRPPSLYAYFSRCLGVVLAPQPELLAVRCGRKLLVPQRIDVNVAFEAKEGGNDAAVGILRFNDLGNRTLRDINDEMKTGLRDAKRADIEAIYRAQTNSSVRLLPPRVKHIAKKLRASLPIVRRQLLSNNACVHLSSTTPWLSGRAGIGLQFFAPRGISITLSGWSRRAVVVENDQIVVRPLLDMAFHFDHNVVDGAPATRFMVAMDNEVSSGRLLSEYPIIPRARKTAPQDSPFVEVEQSEAEPLSIR